MAQLVFGMGMSHSTMVTLDDSLWGEWASQDSTFGILYEAEGQPVTYAELAERAGNRYARQTTPEHWKEQYAAVRRAVARLAAQREPSRGSISILHSRGPSLRRVRSRHTKRPGSRGFLLVRRETPSRQCRLLRSGSAPGRSQGGRRFGR